MNTKTQLLNQWATSLCLAAHDRILSRNQIIIRSVQGIAGPRAGALHVDAGLDAGKLLKILKQNEYALHRQFIPWQFPGQPSIYMSGRYIRLEAGWADHLAEKDIPLHTLPQYPKGNGRWIAGKNESGATITLGLNDGVPHWLFGGQTGSGKSFAMLLAIAQLSKDENNKIILLDAKYGQGLSPLANIPNLVGPLATSPTDIKAALAWSCLEMRRRYEQADYNSPRLIIFFDEIQELTGDRSDEEIVYMIRKLATQGRAAKVHLIIGTQKPTHKAFTSNTIKDNLIGRLAFCVASYDESRVVIGKSTPRADHLLGQGDAFAVVPSATQRTQLAYIPTINLNQYNTTNPNRLTAWPTYSLEDFGNLPPKQTKPTRFNGKEIAVALLAAKQNSGRPTLQKLLKKFGLSAGNSKATHLLKLGRQTNTAITEVGLELSLIKKT